MAEPSEDYLLTFYSGRDFLNATANGGGEVATAGGEVCSGQP